MTLFLQILGSLGVFLFGMKILSEGIQKTAGEKMRSVMATMTKNRFAGLFTGLLTTSLLQSSSATTVIVVSFVNAGLLTLFESIGIIMGANLGTTVTAWIIAIVGKFSISKIAIPIIGIGLPFLFIGKDRWKHLGEVLIGFGLLFNGLGLLKDSVPDVKAMLKSTDPTDVANAEWIQNVVENMSGHGFGSILIFLFAGVLLTLVVQSSSAAMAITVTFAMRGWIGFEESAAIVLGENIGTTVTAWLASLAGNVNARRAARAHFLFNVLGVLWMLVVFYGFIQIVLWLGTQLPASFRPEDASSDIGFSLAIFHTLFNLTNIILLIGFVPWIAKVVEKWVKEKGGHSKMERLTYISKGLVDIGELSLPEAEGAVRGLGQRTESMFVGFMDVFNNPKTDMSEQVMTLKLMEEESDQMLHDITSYLIKCSAAELSEDNSVAVTAMLRIASELEEICDCTYRLVKLTQRKYEKQREFSPEMLEGIKTFSAEVVEFLQFCNSKLFSNVSMADVRKANELEISMDEQRKQLNDASVDRMQKNGDIQAEMLNIDINNHFELIGNHALNIIESAHSISAARAD
jgi:phosphate:Na+ symporter